VAKSSDKHDGPDREKFKVVNCSNYDDDDDDDDNHVSFHLTLWRYINFIIISIIDDVY